MQDGQKQPNLEEDGRRVALGYSAVWGPQVPLELTTADRRRHLYAVGVTGSGKSTLLRNLIVQDIEAGAGVGLIDPHGDLADDVLDLIPPRRTDDVIVFDPSDVDFPPAFNLLAGVPVHRRHLAVSGIIGSLKGVWGDSWGPRLEHLLGNAVAALLEAEGQSLLGVSRMFSDPRYRQWVVKQVSDPVVRAFWERELAAYDKRFLAEAAAPIQNKLGQLFLAPPVRNVLGQVKRKIDLRRAMDSRQVFIAKLPKGKLGADKAGLLGSLLVSQIELAALSRTDVPETARQDFFLYVDEFFSFTTDGFASMLAELRKYRLNLTLAHQYLGQLRQNVREAVFGNAGSLVAFRVGAEDAEVVSRACGSEFSPEHLTDLDNHEVIARLAAHGRHSRAVHGRTTPARTRPWSRREPIRERSRQRFCEPRGRVEERIGRWLAGS